MDETTATPGKPKAARKPRETDLGSPFETEVLPVTASGNEAKEKFSKALDEAKAGAQALTRQAQDTADVYREKLTGKSDALLEEAKVMTGQAKDKAAELAQEGKARAVEGISAVSKIVSENAATIDEKLGPKFGDYARSAARTMDDAAARLDAKELSELGNDARELVRKSPGMAIGIAAAAGFFLSRLFKGSGKSDS